MDVQSNTGDIASEDGLKSGLSGIECIRHYVRNLDGSPGVYRMIGASGEVLYVGKARHLRNRVRSYLNPSSMGRRIEKVVQLTRSMMFLTTKTETEALLLEQNLIKQLKPDYNVLLRDDKSFPTIYLSAHAFPQIRKHRGRKEAKGTHFGPFASATAVNRTINHLQKIFMLRDCSDSTFNNRTRPCLQYQIKRCSAPCVGYIEQGEYAATVEDAKNFLLGRSSRIQKQLADQMELAAQMLEFEKAAALRDRIQALTQIQSVQGVNPQSVGEADVIGLYREGSQACVQVFFIRANQNWGNKALFPKTGEGAMEEEILQAFIGQFYGNKTPPKELILSHNIEDPDLMEPILSSKLGKKVRLTVPKRGERAMLVENAIRNAREVLLRQLSELANQKRLLTALAEAFDLPEAPNRIEVYDNSHIQGAHPYGVMIAVGKEGYLKSSYRKFKIKNADLTPGDDYGMMREVFNRRFKRLLGDGSRQGDSEWPDLVVIDGGEGQLTAASQILDQLGVKDVRLMSISKGTNRRHDSETFHFVDAPKKQLDANDPVLYFIQRMRDEAHRYAIGSHRTARSKSMSTSSLEDIPGVGSRRKRALLSHFGSSKAVAQAAVEDLKAVDGISASLAEVIFDHFR